MTKELRGEVRRCAECGDERLHGRKRSRCYSCEVKRRVPPDRKKAVEYTKAWKRRHPDRHKDLCARVRENLTDGYVRGQLGGGNVPDWMIEQKREQIRQHRLATERAKAESAAAAAAVAAKKERRALALAAQQEKRERRRLERDQQAALLAERRRSRELAKQAAATTREARKIEYARERRARNIAAGLTKDGKPRKERHDAHVAAWRRYCKASKVLHDAHVKEWKSDRSRLWRWRYQNDPAFNAAQRVRLYNRKMKALDGALAAYVAVELKAGRFRFGSITGYTFDELWARLESTMPEDATVDDFFAGRLHIDHIQPRASFDLTDYEQVRACWALTNLQLLWGRDNMRKGARFVTHGSAVAG